MMGLIGIVIASLVNIFIGSSALQFTISIIGIIVFVGLNTTLYFPLMTCSLISVVFSLVL
jgi:FtsH-binding integral membrane protein